MKIKKKELELLIQEGISETFGDLLHGAVNLRKLRAEKNTYSFFYKGLECGPVELDCSRFDFFSTPDDRGILPKNLAGFPRRGKNSNILGIKLGGEDIDIETLFDVENELRTTVSEEPISMVDLYFKLADAAREYGEENGMRI